MIKFFRRIRQRLLSENKFSKYLIYAFGEIILVVIGILIALQINNWNENRRQQKQLMAVYERTLADINSDIEELTAIVEHHDSIEYIFKRVINDSITPDLFDVGLSRLVVANPVATTLNTTGVNQLKAMNTNDSLSIKIIEAYDQMKLIIIDNLEIAINQEIEDLMTLFRDKYDWYPEYMSKTIMQNNSSAALQDYFLNSKEYRYHVINNYNSRYANYVTVLKMSIETLNEITEELKLVLDKS
ncbi:DUF6090 family protein [uncultured Psychroserpens sp.]|uniref:DUF6090 family protein n=1 Tax=uncultured Psychroserpens sp. TaxID=255436 RepID=UPI002631892C|nr:DUF6090 family protein [uncultured Psychroserpens sp.]